MLQRLAAIEPGIGHQAADLLQPKPQFLVKENLLQPLQTLIGVEPVPGVGPARRPKQTDLVVAVQGPHADVRNPRHIADPVHLPCGV